jgi:hypothetical protein
LRANFNQAYKTSSTFPNRSSTGTLATVFPEGDYFLITLTDALKTLHPMTAFGQQSFACLSSTAEVKHHKSREKDA